MTDRDKEVYNDKVCILCKNKDICNKNRFKAFTQRDGKVVMRCSFYRYINFEQ